MTIEIPADLEAGLLAQAQAEGLTVRDYVQRLVCGELAARLGTDSASRPAFELPPEEWVRQFRAWTSSHAGRNLPVLPDEAMSRESIYGDHEL